MCLHNEVLQQPVNHEVLSNLPEAPCEQRAAPEVSPGLLTVQQLLPTMATCPFSCSSLPKVPSLPPGPSTGPCRGKCMCMSDLPEQGLWSGIAPASLRDWCPHSSALSTSSATGKSGPPGRPPERQGTITHTMAVGVSRGRARFLNQEARKKRRFYSEPCLWNLGWEWGMVP